VALAFVDAVSRQTVTGSRVPRVSCAVGETRNRNQVGEERAMIDILTMIGYGVVGAGFGYLLGSIEEWVAAHAKKKRK